MHQENTGSYQQTQVCCLLILYSASSTKDPELKDSYPSNYLYGYFKADIFQNNISLPPYCRPSPPTGYKDFGFKG